MKLCAEPALVVVFAVHCVSVVCNDFSKRCCALANLLTTILQLHSLVNLNPLL